MSYIFIIFYMNNNINKHSPRFQIFLFYLNLMSSVKNWEKTLNFFHKSLSLYSIIIIIFFWYKSTMNINNNHQRHRQTCVKSLLYPALGYPTPPSDAIRTLGASVAVLARWTIGLSGLQSSSTLPDILLSNFYLSIL